MTVTLCRKSKTLRRMLQQPPQSTPCPSNCGVNDCQQRRTVYKYQCQCGHAYLGSSIRTLHERALEHWQGRPTATAITTHRNTCPQSSQGSLEVVSRGIDTVDTRIREAVLIHQQRPELNKRDELVDWLKSVLKVSQSPSLRLLTPLTSSTYPLFFFFFSLFSFPFFPPLFLSFSFSLFPFS